MPVVWPLRFVSLRLHRFPSFLFFSAENSNSEKIENKVRHSWIEKMKRRALLLRSVCDQGRLGGWWKWKIELETETIIEVELMVWKTLLLLLKYCRVIVNHVFVRYPVNILWDALVSWIYGHLWAVIQSHWESTCTLRPKKLSVSIYLSPRFLTLLIPSWNKLAYNSLLCNFNSIASRSRLLRHRL